MSNDLAPSRRAALAVAAGQVVGQLSLVFAVPLITRVFEPEAFGNFQLAAAVSVILAPTLTLCAEFFMPAADEIRCARLYQEAIVRIASGSLLIGFASGVLFLAGAISAAQIGIMTILLSVAYSLTALDNASLIRNGEMRPLAWRNLLAGTLAAGSQLASAYVLASVLGLAAAVLVGRIASIALTQPRAGQYRSSWTEISGRTIKRAHIVAPAMRDATASQATSALSMQSFIFVSTGVFGIAAAGFLGISQRVAGAPAGLVGQALSQISQSLLAPEVRARRPVLVRRLWGQVIPLAVAASIFCMILLVAAPPLAGRVLGANWAFAGALIAILAVPYSLQIVVSPVVTLMIMLEQQSSLLRVQLVRVSLGAGLTLIVGMTSGSLVAACYGFAAVEATASFVLLLLTFIYARRSDASNARVWVGGDMR